MLEIIGIKNKLNDADKISPRTRPGERVAKRRRCKARIGAPHRINQVESIKWFKTRFEGIVR